LFQLTNQLSEIEIEATNFNKSFSILYQTFSEIYYRIFNRHGRFFCFFRLLSIAFV